MAPTPPRVSRRARSRVRRDAWRTVLPILVVGCLVLSVVVVAGGSAVRRDVGCGLCHRGHVAANQDSAHQGLRCAECHASPGAAGLVADGLRSIRWLSVSPFRDAQPGFAPERACRECHSFVLTSTVTTYVRVRHADFAEERCARCHAGTGHRVDAERRWYAGPLMEDCTGCHRVSGTNVDACYVCHPPGLTRQRPEDERSTVFTASHGAGWQRAHGMGDMSGCTTCHIPADCAKCHGIPLPHQQGWQRVHGDGLTEPVRERCSACHDPQWCTDCHGIEMPHGDGFLPAHGGLAEGLKDVCYRCHVEASCAQCHYSAEHNQAPGVDYHFGAGDPQ